MLKTKRVRKRQFLEPSLNGASLFIRPLTLDLDVTLPHRNGLVDSTSLSIPLTYQSLEVARYKPCGTIMNLGSAQLHQYASLEASFDSNAHLLYFVPLGELQKAARTDSSSVVVVAFVGRSSGCKSVLSNLMSDQSIFMVRLIACITIFTIVVSHLTTSSIRSD